MWKRQAIIIVILISVLILDYGTAFAEGPNYCRDKESWKQWDALVAKQYDDDGVPNRDWVIIGAPCRAHKNKGHSRPTVAPEGGGYEYPKRGCSLIIG